MKMSTPGDCTRRLGRPQSLHKLEALAKRQQVQIGALSRRQSQLREEAEALRECLTASGALAPARFLASLHRRRFEEVIRQHPSHWPGSLETVILNQELALATATSAGAACVMPLATACRALHRGVGSLLEEHPHLFPTQLYAVGGADDLAETLRSVERFDSASCVWEPVAPLREARESCAVVAANGSLYVLGGLSSSAQCLDTAEHFNPAMGRWESLPPMNRARVAAAAVSAGGQVYVMGGRDGFQSLASAERYNPNSKTWQVLPPLRSARFGAAAAALSGRVFVVGGKGGGRVLDAVEALQLDAGVWATMPSLHARRYRAAAVASQGRLYVVGGCDGSWETGLRSAEFYEPEVAVWRILAPLQVPRWGAAAVSAAGSVCVLGGRNGGGALSSVERFDATTGIWEPMPSLAKARKFCGAAACRN